MIWDVLTFPFHALHWFVKLVEVTWDGFDPDALYGQIKLPLEIHPRKSLGGTAIAVYDLWPDGEIRARFSYQLKLIVPLDQDIKKVKAIA